MSLLILRFCFLGLDYTSFLCRQFAYSRNTLILMSLESMSGGPELWQYSLLSPEKEHDVKGAA